MLDKLCQSDLRFDKFFRLRFDIKSRIDALSYQAQYWRRQGAVYSIGSYEVEIEALNILLYRLDNNYLNCNSVYKEIYSVWRKFPRKVDEHSFKLFGAYLPRKANYDYEVQRCEFVLDHCKGVASYKKAFRNLQIAKENRELNRLYREDLKRNLQNRRRAELIGRLRYEILYCVRNNWFVVFNTLSVDDISFDKVFSFNSRRWTDYVRFVDRAVGCALHLSWRRALHERRLGNDFHKYFAVVERGTISGRLHIHVLHFMKCLPKGCFDPNKGALVPCRREIDVMKPYWKYGHSTPIAVRFSTHDAYGRISWRYPVVSIGHGKYESLPIKPPQAIVAYISKYITDIYDGILDKEVVLWRTRLSRNLGMLPLNLIVERMKFHQVSLLLKTPLVKSLSMLNNKVPMFLLRKLLLKRYLTKLRMKSSSLSVKALTMLERRENILNRYKSVMLTTTKSIDQKIGRTVIRTLNDMEGFDISNIILSIEKELFGDYSYPIFMKGMSMEVMNA